MSAHNEGKIITHADCRQAYEMVTDNSLKVS